MSKQHNISKYNSNKQILNTNNQINPNPNRKLIHIPKPEPTQALKTQNSRNANHYTHKFPKHTKLPKSQSRSPQYTQQVSKQTHSKQVSHPK